MLNSKNLSLDDIESLEFWQSISPMLSITNKPFVNCAGTEYICDDTSACKMKHQVIEDGYFELPTIIDPDEITVLRDTVLRLDQHRIMPNFTFMYDEFWQLLFRLRKLFSSFMLDDYKLIPDIWMWHVAADDKSSGWKPHRDGDFEVTSIRDDGTPTMCTAWVALTDVSTSNSCMYLLSRKHDVAFQNFIRKKFGQPSIANSNEIPFPFSHIRALPVNAGAIIGWDHNALHWGSASSKWASGPRISMGIDYQSVDSPYVPPVYDNDGRRFIECSPGSVLTFENRLTILANIINIYSHKFENGGETEEHYTPVIKAFMEKWKRD